MTPARWRTGRKVGQHLYRQAGPEPSDDDPPTGTMFDPADAQRAVDAVNAQAGRDDDPCYGNPVEACTSPGHVGGDDGAAEAGSALSDLTWRMHVSPHSGYCWVLGDAPDCGAAVRLDVDVDRDHAADDCGRPDWARVANDVAAVLNGAARPAPDAPVNRNALVEAFKNVACVKLLDCPGHAEGWYRPGDASAPAMADVALAALRGGARDEVAEQAHAELNAITEAVRAAGHPIPEEGPQQTLRAVQGALRGGGVEAAEREFTLLPPAGWLNRVDELLRYHHAAFRDGAPIGAALGALLRSWEVGKGERDRQEREGTAPGPAYWGPRDGGFLSRLARAAGHDLDPGDPVGGLEKAIRERWEPEVVSGAGAAKLPHGSRYVACDNDGVPLGGAEVYMMGVIEGELSALTDYVVLYRAPEPARTFAVGDPVTTAEELEALPVGTVLRAADGALCELESTGWRCRGFSIDVRLPGRVLDLPAKATS